MNKICVPTFLSAILLVSISGFTIDNQADDLERSMERGNELYIAHCITCHMHDGKGIPNVFPPLAASDYMMEDLDRSIKQIIYGASGEMEVNGVVYNGVMSGFDLSDQEIADILNYIRNSWGNKGEIVTAQRVVEVR
ncbi:Putative nitrite reductase [Fulvivirga imtechensis AK7]|uniref:Putative nitrite reductase n=1 Tax=Fulvivirga imtechensis AK7 TaxID=1237149 RepID=L8JLQ2_9BACT|nr:cytochrome c [Fulvivirga imtechensis]ELR68307.1 Putative nitrite reductase [Fulvivirga imtechensis AK7]